jgi:hypothetical protein
MSPITYFSLISDEYHEVIRHLCLACQAVMKESFTKQELTEAQLRVNEFKEKFVNMFGNVPIDPKARDRM